MGCIMCSDGFPKQRGELFLNRGGWRTKAQAQASYPSMFAAPRRRPTGSTSRAPAPSGSPQIFYGTMRCMECVGAQKRGRKDGRKTSRPSDYRPTGLTCSFYATQLPSLSSIDCVMDVHFGFCVSAMRLFCF